MAQTINTAVTRTDAPRKVTGTATYAADVMPAGHAARRARHLGDRRGHVDRPSTPAAPRPSRASWRSSPTRTCPTTRPSRGSMPAGPASASFWPMEGTEIKYAGQPIAYVVAETAAAARRGAQLIEATYEEARGSASTWTPAKASSSARKGTPRAWSPPRATSAKGLADAAQTVEVEYTTPFQHHNPMEMFAATAEWRRRPADRLDAVAIGAHPARAASLRPTGCRKRRCG